MILFPNQKPPEGFLIIFTYEEDSSSYTVCEIVSSLKDRLSWYRDTFSSYTLIEVLTALQDMVAFSMDIEKFSGRYLDIYNILVEDLCIDHISSFDIFLLAQKEPLNIRDLKPYG